MRSRTICLALVLTWLVLAPAAALVGPRLVADVNPGSDDSSPSVFAVLGDMLLFTANTREYGYELWRTDGTAAGTQLVRDIRLGASTSSPANLTVAGDHAFFTANDGTPTVQLWATQGTAETTQLVKSLPMIPGSSILRNLTAVGNRVFFTHAETATGEEVYVSDGTEVGTRLVKDISPGPGGSIVRTIDYSSKFIAFQGLLYFTANDGQHGVQLWKTDGSDAGTIMVSDLQNRIAGSGPESLVVFEDLLFFTAFVQLEPAVGSEIWRSDGTTEGTFRPFGAGNGPLPSGALVGAGPALYFPGYVREPQPTYAQLWKTDGTMEGSGLVKLIHPTGAAFDTSPARPPLLTPVRDLLYFLANDGVHGIDLWRSDGTEEGTILVRDTPEPLGVRNLTAWGDHLAFTDGGGPSQALWLSDGSSAGTTPFWSMTAAYPESLRALDDKLFFVATVPPYGRELFVIYSGDGPPIPSPTATPSPTLTATPKATATASSTPTVPSSQCVVDCSTDMDVSVHELIVGVHIALGRLAREQCVSFDGNADQKVTIEELVAVVNRARNRCSPPQTVRIEAVQVI